MSFGQVAEDTIDKVAISPKSYTRLVKTFK